MKLRQPVPKRRGVLILTHPHAACRDKKALQAQVEKLGKALEGRDAEHEAAAALLAAQNAAAASAAAAELEESQRGRVSDRVGCQGGALGTLESG